MLTHQFLYEVHIYIHPMLLHMLFLHLMKIKIITLPHLRLSFPKECHLWHHHRQLFYYCLISIERYHGYYYIMVNNVQSLKNPGTKLSLQSLHLQQEVIIYDFHWHARFLYRLGYAFLNMKEMILYSRQLHFSIEVHRFRH